MLVSPYQPGSPNSPNASGPRPVCTSPARVPVRAQGGFLPYDVTPNELVEQVEQVGVLFDAVVLFSGTGCRAARAGPRALEIDRILLTSNLCSAWWALAHATGQPVTLSRLPYRRGGTGPAVMNGVTVVGAGPVGADRGAHPGPRRRAR